MAFLSDPFQSLFDRSRRNKDQVSEEGEEEEDDDDSGDLQALIDVGEAEGILEEEEGELIHSIIEFGDTRVSEDRKSTRLNSSHSQISYAVFCLKKKKKKKIHE